MTLDFPANAPTLGLILTVATLAGACASGEATATASVTVAMPLGSRQCEAGGATPAALAQPLRASGVSVASAGCGHDGRMRPAVCGAPDGQLAVLEIDAAHLPAARAAGWRPLAEWPGAARRPCPQPGGSTPATR